MPLYTVASYRRMAKKSNQKERVVLLLIKFQYFAVKNLEISSSNSFHIDHHPLQHPMPSASIPVSPRSYQLLQQQQQQQERPSLLRTVLNLTGCVMGVAGSICYEVTSYWAKVRLLINIFIFEQFCT